MYTQHHPCWDAKNRFDLADEIPMDYEQIRFIFESAPVPVQPPAPAISAPEPLPETTASDIPTALQDLMAASGITEDKIRKACAMKGYFPEDMPISAYPAEFVEGVLIGAWGQIVDFINADYPF